jgi:hypothetical protein
VYIDPSNVSNVAVGSTFIVEAHVFNVTDLFTWQVQIQFNASELNCLTATYPSSGYIFEGKTQVWVAPLIDNIAGTVTFGASLIYSDSASGSGGLCEITFEVMAIGESSMNFSLPYGDQTFLLRAGNLDIIPATLQNGSFSNDSPVGVQAYTLTIDYAVTPIPELSTLFILPLFAIATLVALIVFRRRKKISAT